MVLDPLPAVETGGAGLVNYSFEITVIGIAKNQSKVPARPELIAHRAGTADALKGGNGGGGLDPE